MTKQDINTICWWIPFKKTRNAVRNTLTIILSLRNVSSDVDTLRNVSSDVDTLKNVSSDVDTLKKFIIDEALPICARDNERELLQRHLREAKYYLEFGCGGSTFFMLEHTNANIISVESDKSFINYISKFGVIKNLDNKSRLTFYHIDLGKTKEWGYPIDNSRYDQYPNYSQSIFKTLDKSQIERLDTVFIDGRFRVACLLSVLLNCNNKTKIIIHDFFSRPHYHVVLDFIDVVEQVDTLGIFKFKDNIDYDRVKTLLEEYQYILD